jgi:hypothetical protein
MLHMQTVIFNDRSKQDSSHAKSAKIAAQPVCLPHLAACDLDHLSILSANVECIYQLKKIKSALRVVILANVNDE